jgi:hypothetical protein
VLCCLCNIDHRDTQEPAEVVVTLRHITRRAEISDDWYRLLHARRHRPRRSRAAEQRAPLHSISLVGAQEECLRARSCDFSEI